MHSAAHSQLPSLHTNTQAPHGRRAWTVPHRVRGLLIIQVILHAAPRRLAAHTGRGTLFTRRMLLCQARGLTALGLALMSGLAYGPGCAWDGEARRPVRRPALLPGAQMA